VSPIAPRRPRRHAGEHDLIEALDQPGCPVCRLATEAVDAYLTSVCYEQVNDLDVRDELREAGGYCGAHAHRFLHQRHGPLASAIVYRDVLANAARRIKPAIPQNGSFLGGLLAGRNPRRSTVGVDPQRCPACHVLDESERRHLETLRTRIVDPSVQASYRAADGLCLPHLDKALAADGDGVRLLAEAAIASLGRLVEELDTFIRKHDYRFRPDVWEGDEDTPARAVERAVGRAEPGS
jgi:hypothetical protein